MTPPLCYLINFFVEIKFVQRLVRDLEFRGDAAVYISEVGQAVFSNIRAGADEMMEL